MVNRGAPRLPDLVSSQRRIPPGLITFAAVAVSAVLAYQMGRSGEGNAGLLVVAILAPLGLLVIVSSSLEQAVLGFLAYSAFEGLLKNVSAGNPAVYLLRDLFLLAILGKLLFGDRGPGMPARPRKVSPAAAAVSLPITLFIIITVAQFFNPTHGDLRTNFIIGLGGLHQRILPMVLFFAVLRMVESRHQVDRIHRLLVFLGLVVGIVLLFQVAIGPERWRALGFSFYSQGAGTVFSPQAYRAGVERPASIAQDSGAAAWFILTAILLTIGRLTRPRVSIGAAARWMVFGGILFLAILLSYMRTAYMALALSLGLFLLLRSRYLGGRLPVVVGGALLVVFVLTAAMPETYLDAIYHRAEKSVLNPIESYATGAGARLPGLLEIPYTIAERPLGVGTGRTGPGQATFRQWFPEERFEIVENGFGAIIMEAGLLAGLLVLWVFLAVLSHGLRGFRRLRDEELKAAAAAMLVYVCATLAAMLSMNPLDASPFNSYLWLFAGLLAVLPDLEASEQEAAQP